MTSNQRRRTRAALRAVYGDACHWCGGEMDFQWAVGNSNSEFASIEHLTPRSEGGSDDYDNLRLAHLRCNHARNEQVPA